MGDTVRTDTGEVVHLDSLGYYAYRNTPQENWYGVCKPFPEMRAYAATGSEALNEIKKFVHDLADTQALN